MSKIDNQLSDIRENLEHLAGQDHLYLVHAAGGIDAIASTIFRDSNLDTKDLQQLAGTLCVLSRTLKNRAEDEYTRFGHCVNALDEVCEQLKEARDA